MVLFNLLILQSKNDGMANPAKKKDFDRNTHLGDLFNGFDPLVLHYKYLIQTVEAMM